jgi:hypothetical protein
MEVMHMQWLKRDLWKTGIYITGALLLLVVMVWIPVSAVDTHRMTSELATPGTVTMQTAPVVDPTVAAQTAQEQLTKLRRENDRSVQAWLWNSVAALGTIGAALIAVFGVLRTARVAQDKNLADRQAEREKREEILVQRYLFRLQDALEALDYRLDNLGRRGRPNMPEEYFKESTLYALGKVLAVERIFALEAVYPQLERIYPGLGEFLKKLRIDHLLQQPDFWQYDRLSLAEAVMEHEGDLFRPSTYLEFRRRYEAEHSPEKQWLAPASEAILSLPTGEKLQKLRQAIATIAERIADETGIAWSK